MMLIEKQSGVNRFDIVLSLIVFMFFECCYL